MSYIINIKKAFSFYYARQYGYIYVVYREIYILYLTIETKRDPVFYPLLTKNETWENMET